MPKSPKKTPTKPVAKRDTKTLSAKAKSTKEPKMNFMMKALKEREEKSKQMGQQMHSVKPMPQSYDQKGHMNNHGFGRFAGPRRKAG